MKSTLGHLQVNVAPANLGFYKDLLTFAGWTTIMENESMAGFGAESGPSLWFIGTERPADNDYDAPGTNHLGLSVEAQADVDAAVAFLAERNIPALFETPRHRHEFTGSEDQTYYQVMFESPDRVLFEIVYTGPKS